MAVDHTMDEAEKALDERGLRQQSIAANLAEQAQADPAVAHQLEIERQAAYHYYEQTGNDFLDLSPAAQKAYLAGSKPLVGGVDEVEDLSDVPHLQGAPEPTSLQDRMNLLGEAIVEENSQAPRFARGGLTVIRWGLMRNDDDEDYTLGLSVQYNDNEPGQVYLDITQQKIKEWRSLQGKDGEVRMAMGIVQHLVDLTGEDIAVAIASALGELVEGQVDDVHADRPTETSVGDDDVVEEASS